MRLWPSLLTVLAATAAYREWVFLSSGVDMSYSDGAAMADAQEFDNVFAPPAAYAAFKRTGVWPDQTMLVLENRMAKSKGSINRQGLFQTGEVMGLEAHVKDTARFKGGWAFFAMQGDAPAKQIPYTAECYSCHQAHGAADTTFVQFYPTLLPVATRLGTLGPAYGRKQKVAKINKPLRSVERSHAVLRRRKVITRFRKATPPQSNIP
jgi:hypothetical protein